MLYTVNTYICQLFLNKVRKKTKKLSIKGNFIM